MQRFALSTLAVAMLAATASPASGQYRDRHNDQRNLRADTAQVVRVKERFERNRGHQYQECWNDRTRQNEGGYYRDDDGRLHQYDARRKDGNASGAVIGAIIGGALGNHRGTTSYLVSYRYASQTYQAVMSTRPGRYLRALVDVQPQEQPVSYNR